MLIPPALHLIVPHLFELFRIMIAALSFLLDYENIEGDDSDDLGSEDELATQQPQIVVSKEAMYKVGCFVWDLSHIFCLLLPKLWFLWSFTEFLPYFVKFFFHDL